MISLSENITENLFRAITSALQPFHLLVITIAGWRSRHERMIIDYLIEENRILQEHLEGQRL